VLRTRKGSRPNLGWLSLARAPWGAAFVVYQGVTMFWKDVSESDKYCFEKLQRNFHGSNENHVVPPSKNEPPSPFSVNASADQIAMLSPTSPIACQQSKNRRTGQHGVRVRRGKPLTYKARTEARNAKNLKEVRQDEIVARRLRESAKFPPPSQTVSLITRQAPSLSPTIRLDRIISMRA
jgi:hypothetical protein